MTTQVHQPFSGGGCTMTTTIRAAVLGSFLVATAVLAQEDTKTGGKALRAKSIIGAKVDVQGGTGVGTVEDIVLNDEGVVEYFIVSEGGKLVTVPWDAAKFNFEKRMATINITEEQYRKIPTYTTERYPDYYTPTYRTQVYKYYNLTP